MIDEMEAANRSLDQYQGNKIKLDLSLSRNAVINPHYVIMYVWCELQEYISILRKFIADRLHLANPRDSSSTHL